MSKRIVLVLVAALLAACSSDPTTSRHFWRDAALVEAELGVTAVEIAVGEPLWDFPLVTVSRDAIRFDARPWLAAKDRDALPPEAFEEWSFEVPVQDGVVPEEKRRGTLIVRLFEQTREWTRRVDFEANGEPWHAVNILAEEDVSWELVRQVYYTLGQATVWPPVPVGRVGPELRGAQAGRAEPYYQEPCVGEVYLDWGPNSRHVTLIQPGEGVEHRYLVVPDGESLAEPLADLGQRCVGLWDAGAEELAGREGLVEPARWRCVSVISTPDASVPMKRILRSLAEGYPLAPDIVMHFPLGGISGTAELPERTGASLDEADLGIACGTARVDSWAVGRTGLDAILGTTGSASDGEAVRDLLSDDGALEGDVAKALEKVGAPPAPPAEEETP